MSLKKILSSVVHMSCTFFNLFLLFSNLNLFHNVSSSLLDASRRIPSCAVIRLFASVTFCVRCPSLPFLNFMFVLQIYHFANYCYMCSCFFYFFPVSISKPAAISSNRRSSYFYVSQFTSLTHSIL